MDDVAPLLLHLGCLLHHNADLRKRQVVHSVCGFEHIDSSFLLLDVLGNCFLY